MKPNIESSKLLLVFFIAGTLGIQAQEVVFESATKKPSQEYLNRQSNSKTYSLKRVRARRKIYLIYAFVDNLKAGEAISKEAKGFGLEVRVRKYKKAYLVQNRGHLLLRKHRQEWSKIKRRFPSTNWKTRRVPLMRMIYQVKKSAAGKPESFTFGGASTSPGSTTSAEASPAAEEDLKPSPFSAQLLSENGLIAKNSHPFKRNHFLKLKGQWEPQLEGSWNYGLGLDARFYLDVGDKDVSESVVHPEGSFVSRRQKQSTYELGFNPVVWGRVYENSVFDLLSRYDLKRALLGSLDTRRLAQPNFRWQYYADQWKIDLVVIPIWMKPLLPPTEGIWSAVDLSKGRLMGLNPDPIVTELIRTGSVATETGSKQAAGFSVSKNGEAIDFGFSLIRAPSPMPFFHVSEKVVSLLLQGQPVANAIALAGESTFKVDYPETLVVGADVGGEWLGVNWRGELAHYSEAPIITEQFEFKTAPQIKWTISSESFPGDSDFRLNIQLSGGHIQYNKAILNPKDDLILSGAAEQEFGLKWKLNLRTAWDPRQTGMFYSAKINYSLSESTNLYLIADAFDGKDPSPLGFYRDNDMLSLGLSGTF